MPISDSPSCVSHNPQSLEHTHTMCWSRVTIEFLIVARPLPWRVFMTASITRTSTESTSISPNKPSSARSASAPNRTMRLTLDQRRKRGLGKGNRQEVNVNRAKQAKQIQISMWCASSRAAGGCVSRSLFCCLYLSPAFLLSLSLSLTRFVYLPSLTCCCFHGDRFLWRCTWRH